VGVADPRADGGVPYPAPLTEGALPKKREEMDGMLGARMRRCQGTRVRKAEKWCDFWRGPRRLWPLKQVLALRRYGEMRRVGRQCQGT
jgi:hypothetical protein